MADERETNTMLYRISNELRGFDLQNLKHLCHGRIPLGELEKAQSSYDLFRVMLQKRLIKPGNFTFLVNLLNQIGRADLAGKIHTSGGDVTMQTESPLASNPLEGNYREVYRGFLMKLSDELSSALASNPLEWSKFRGLLLTLSDVLPAEKVKLLLLIVSDGSIEKTQNGKDLFKYLIQRGSIDPNNLTHLVDMLQEIHRRDLAEKVRKFQADGGVTRPSVTVQTPPLQYNRPTQQPPRLVTEKQPTIRESRPPTIPLSSLAAFTQPQASGGENAEPQFPVQAMPNPAELVEPLQGLGVDEEEAMPAYPMTRRPRGIAVIISNEHFEENPSLRDRQGNEKDVQHLQDLWHYLNFEVVLYRDLDSLQMFSALRDISTMDHSQYDCLVCCLLSHGADGGIFGTDWKLVDIKDITALFKGIACPSLGNKPKLFFIQACRGQNIDRGVRIVADTSEVTPEDAMRHNAEPNESHFLLGYATPPGYISWRSETHGSWYISKLCEVFRKFCERFDVMTMMVKVNDEVSDAFTSMGYEQCPAPVVTLRRRIYFNNNNNNNN